MTRIERALVNHLLCSCDTTKTVVNVVTMCFLPFQHLSTIKKTFVLIALPAKYFLLHVSM